MDLHSQLSALIDLAESLGIMIRRAPPADESADHPGGALVRLKGKEMLFLDPTASVADQITVAAGALRGRAELDNMFLPPEIRERLDQA